MWRALYLLSKFGLHHEPVSKQTGFTNFYHLHALHVKYTDTQLNMNTRVFQKRLFFIFLYKKRAKHFRRKKGFVSPFFPLYFNLGPLLNYSKLLLQFETVAKSFFFLSFENKHCSLMVKERVANFSASHSNLKKPMRNLK